jgi:hypothetical protein
MGKKVRFARRPARIGDKIDQVLELDMRLATAIRQGNELVDKYQTTVRTGQRRVVTATEIADGRTTAVRVQYLKATKEVSAADGTDAEQPAANSQSEAQPVAGKTYLCRREPGDDGKLIITDEKGSIPPMDEYEIVAQHMDVVGRANPLADFLADKTIAVGETVAVPPEIADRIFNLGDQFGDVSQFDLTLQKSVMHDGAPSAEFFAHIEAASNDSSPMRLQVEGPLVVQADTCRAVNLNLSGPIGMAEKRGSYSTAYLVIGTGQLKVSIASAYRDSTR